MRFSVAGGVEEGVRSFPPFCTCLAGCARPGTKKVQDAQDAE